MIIDKPKRNYGLSNKCERILRLCHYNEMLPIVLFYTTLFNSLLPLGAQRPFYRFDYQYEKTFDSFYKLHPTGTTWPEARIRCAAEGSELLVLDSLDEADSVVILVTLILNKFEGIFVGIHDLYSERAFVTIRGTTIMDTILNLLWEYREPMYRHGRCVAMRRTGRLFVHPCEKPLPFICKTKGKDIQFRPECNTFDPDWKLGPNNTCYFMQVEPQTWSQAYASCLSAGGHLAILNNQSEANHLKAMFKQLHQRPRRMPVEDLAFLGYNDFFQRHHYRTIHGEPIDDVGYKEWEVSCSSPEQENAFNESSSARCGGMRRNGLLAIGHCHVPHMFFCEKPGNTSMVLNHSLRLGALGTIALTRNNTLTPRPAYESYE